jgi:trimethyllysine dioxygenase
LEHQGEGGHTLLVDGFFVAQKLKEQYPEYYDVLTRINVPTHSAGDKEILIHPTPKSGFPIVRVSPKTNEVYQIRYNNHDRSVLSGQQFSPKDIDHFYRALKAWKDIVTDKQVEFWTKMKPGTAVIVDNWRVLHGRSSFTGKRRLCGAYLNWDDYRSRINTVLDKKKMKDDL